MTSSTRKTPRDLTREILDGYRSELAKTQTLAAYDALLARIDAEIAKAEAQALAARMVGL